MRGDLVGSDIVTVFWRIAGSGSWRDLPCIAEVLCHLNFFTYKGITCKDQGHQGLIWATTFWSCSFLVKDSGGRYGYGTVMLPDYSISWMDPDQNILQRMLWAPEISVLKAEWASRIYPVLLTTFFSPLEWAMKRMLRHNPWVSSNIGLKHWLWKAFYGLPKTSHIFPGSKYILSISVTDYQGLMYSDSRPFIIGRILLHTIGCNFHMQSLQANDSRPG